MVWVLMLQIHMHVYYGDLDFIVLFLCILPLYAINYNIPLVN